MANNSKTTKKTTRRTRSSSTGSRNAGNTNTRSRKATSRNSSRNEELDDDYYSGRNQSMASYEDEDDTIGYEDTASGRYRGMDNDGEEGDMSAGQQRSYSSGDEYRGSYEQYDDDDNYGRGQSFNEGRQSGYYEANYEGRNYGMSGNQGRSGSRRGMSEFDDNRGYSQWGGQDFGREEEYGGRRGNSYNQGSEFDDYDSDRFSQRNQGRSRYEDDNYSGRQSEYGGQRSYNQQGWNDERGYGNRNDEWSSGRERGRGESYNSGGYGRGGYDEWSEGRQQGRAYDDDRRSGHNQGMSSYNDDRGFGNSQRGGYDDMGSGGRRQGWSSHHGDRGNGGNREFDNSRNRRSGNQGGSGYDSGRRLEDHGRSGRRGNRDSWGSQYNDDRGGRNREY